MESATPKSSESAARVTHLDDQHRPTMVDVGDKGVSTRTAIAEAIVRFPSGVLESLEKSSDRERRSAKGPVFQTAIVAGIQAAKKTHEWIPLCHVIPLEHCSIHIEEQEQDRLWIECRVRATHKTGVEMEALTGASAAALTIYDMCKALSHEIVIEQVRLREKTGGKRDFHDPR